jgi:DNA-binding Lrp family transcriptional regulator
MSEWSFLTNHGAVLMLIAQHGQITAKAIADTLGITERPVRRIIAELEADGYLKKQRVGRVNWYHVQHDLPLRQPIVRDLAVRDLLQILTPVSPKKGEE